MRSIFFLMLMFSFQVSCSQTQNTDADAPDSTPSETPIFKIDAELQKEPPRPQCGDGKKEDPEQCDDQNEISGDGCSKDCEIEPGFECSLNGEKSLCQKSPDERLQQIDAFQAGEGPDHRELTLKGLSFSKDFKVDPDSPCVLFRDSPNAKFEIDLNPGELFSVRVSCFRDQCPVPAISARKPEPLTEKYEMRSHPACGMQDEIGYDYEKNPLARSYRSQKKEKIYVEIAWSLRTRKRENERTEAWDHYPVEHYKGLVDSGYQIEMIRDRRPPSKLPLGQNPKKPILASFDQDGRFVVQGANFADDFATPKQPQIKIDRKLPWMPSAFVAVDLKAGEKLKAKSNLGHFALVRIGKTAQWISDDWSPYNQEEWQSDEMARKERLKLPLEYEAKKDERIYFVVSPEVNCLWEGCREYGLLPHQILKGQRKYSGAAFREMLLEFNEAERDFGQYVYERCDQKSCGIRNQGPYRIELWKE